MDELTSIIAGGVLRPYFIFTPATPITQRSAAYGALKRLKEEDYAKKGSEWQQKGVLCLLVVVRHCRVVPS